MKVTKINWKGKSRAEWSKQRKELEGIGDTESVRIGASDVSVILGTNKWKCPARLFHHLTGFHDSFFMTERTISGHLMEDIIKRRWEALDTEDEMATLENVMEGTRLRKIKPAKFFMVNSLYPYSFVSLDMVPDGEQFSPFTGEKYEPNTPNEMKHTNKDYYRRWNNGIADQYYSQVQYQMAVSGTNLCVFHVLVDGVEYHVKEIERNQSYIDSMMSQVEDFAKIVMVGKRALHLMRTAKSDSEREHFQNIYDQVTPEPTYLEDDLNLVNEIYSSPIDDDIMIKQGDLDDLHLMQRYIKATSLENKLKDLKFNLRSRLVISCGDKEGIEVGGYKMLNRRGRANKRNHFSIKEVK